MSESLTEANFAQHLNTTFRVHVTAPRPIELELVGVEGWNIRPEEQSGMERFSIYFHGPADLYMPQGVYKLEHEQMGTFDLFLVPIAKDASGFRYEAVFNYFK
jgi:hypothetical protein